MSYAGITKGTTAIAAAMLLGAAHFGCGEALIAELSASQPEMLTRMRRGMPGMYDKAYRWVGEMEEIADFHEANPAARDMYAAIARLYQFLAEAEAEQPRDPDNAISTLDRVLGR
jgi:putative dehydrogenase